MGPRKYFPYLFSKHLKTQRIKTMKKVYLSLWACLLLLSVSAQTNPAITSWLQNTTTYGSHYVQGNSTAIQDDALANVQKVQYSDDWVYISATGVPAYPTGPFLDRNPSLASDQEAIFKLPLNPTENTSGGVETRPGNNGIFINGVALFDYRDGVSYNNSAGEDQGGPTGGRGDGVWNRDAVVAEMEGFDCSKGHPAMGNYHHHQNPSAFKLDKEVVSTICNLYDADALYTLNESQHSPLIGFAYDGFPIYGAYGYKNTDGTGGIVRMKSSWKLRDITERTELWDGTDVTDGPVVSAEYPLGHYREDYGYVASSDPDYLDEHNGRFCVTPEYPEGIYCYFATVDENWNSAYPYVIGPEFYGNVDGGSVTSISETVTTYDDATSLDDNFISDENFTVFPNPAQEFIAVQATGLVESNISLKLYDMKGVLVRETEIKQGSTLFYIDVRTLYAGEYVLHISNGQTAISRTVLLGEKR